MKIRWIVGVEVDSRRGRVEGEQEGRKEGRKKDLVGDKDVFLVNLFAVILIVSSVCKMRSRRRDGG